MKHLGMHVRDNWEWADLVSAKRPRGSNSMGAKHARKLCKRIAKAEKRSERQKALREAISE
jgi:hypothetical protein